MIRIVLILVGVISLSLPADAQVVAKVVCPAGGTGAYKTISAALAAFPPSKGPLTINASGTCKENPDLSRLSGVIINGSPQVTITPKIAASPTITAGGTTTLNNVIIISNTSGVGINALAGTNLMLNSSSVTGAGSGITQYSGGTMDLYNTTINVTGFTGLATYGGILLVQAYDDGQTSITSGSLGVDCQQSRVGFYADANSSISVANNSNIGLYGKSCAVDAYSSSPVIFSGNGKGGQGAALDLRGGFAVLTNFTFSNNNGYAAVVADQGGNIELGGSSITNNAGIGVQANVGGVIHYASYDGDGVTTIQGNSLALGCYQGSKQYADSSSSISPAVKASACLQIGGP